MRLWDFEITHFGSCKTTIPANPLLSSLCLLSKISFKRILGWEVCSCFEVSFRSKLNNPAHRSITNQPGSSYFSGRPTLYLPYPKPQLLAPGMEHPESLVHPGRTCSSGFCVHRYLVTLKEIVNILWLVEWFLAVWAGRQAFSMSLYTLTRSWAMSSLTTKSPL